MDNTNDNSYTIGEGITAADTPQAVTVTITGQALENLRKLAEAFGKWDERQEITAAELLAEYLADDDAFAGLAKKNRPTEISTFAGMVVDKFKSCDDADALEAAFKAEGFAVNY